MQRGSRLPLALAEPDRLAAEARLSRRPEFPEARSETRADSEPVWGGLCAGSPGVRWETPTEPGVPKT
eukprot:14830091-Alexandrium_andersonii.AAC.1